jgi:hypothetical protein
MITENKKNMANFQKVKLGDVARMVDCPRSTSDWVENGVFAVRNFNYL